MIDSGIIDYSITVSCKLNADAYRYGLQNWVVEIPLSFRKIGEILRDITARRVLALPSARCPLSTPAG